MYLEYRELKRNFKKKNILMENYEHFCYILRFIFPEIIFLRLKDAFLRISNFSKSVIFIVPHQCFCSLHMHVVAASKRSEAATRSALKIEILFCGTKFCARGSNLIFGGIKLFILARFKFFILSEKRFN